MAVTQNTYTGNGSTTNYSFTFPYLETTDIKVSLNGVDTTAYTLANATTVSFNTAPSNGAAIRIYRDTDDSTLAATFYPGSAIRATDLNDNFTQNLYSTQEVKARYLDRQSGEMDAAYVPTISTDVVTKGYMETNYGVIDEVGFTRWRQVATAGQTVFSGAGSYGNNLSFVPNREQVYLNGALQQINADYTTNTAGTTITFSVSLTVGDIVDVVCINNLVQNSTTSSDDLSFVQSGTGAVTRSIGSKLRDVVSVKDFGAVGDGVTDDTTAIQAAVNEAMKYGKQILFEGPGPYCISSTITVKVTRDLGVTDTSPASDIHFTDNTSAYILGLGTPTLKAISSMASMVELIFDTSDSDIGPFYSKVEGLGFDGNSLATSGLKSNYSMHVTIERNRFWNLSRGIEYTGYGVAKIRENTFKCTNALYFVNGGGDSTIIGNDFYSRDGVAGACIYLGYYTGNSRIFSNVFTNEDGIATTKYAVQFAGSTAPASQEIRDIVIRDNEFCGFTNAIRLDGKASGTKNIYRILVAGNHTLPYGASNPGSLVAAVDCVELNITGNFCNSASLSSATSPGIELVRCEKSRVRSNFFANYSGLTFSITNCIDTLVESNTFRDCATTGTSYVVSAVYGSSSARNYFLHNVFRQSSGSYGQYGILEDTGVDYTYSHNNTFDGFTRPHTKVGANSIMRRTEYASSVPVSGSYYQGDIVWNTAPSAGGTPGWVCTTSGVTTFTFKAMSNLAA